MTSETFTHVFACEKQEVFKTIPSRTIVQFVQEGNLNKDMTEFSLDFTDAMLYNIADAQLKLVAQDLKIVDKQHEDYLSAVEFIETDRFQTVCEAMGLNYDETYNHCHWLIYRYSEEYVTIIDRVVNMKPFESDLIDTSGIEFALELAGEIYPLCCTKSKIWRDHYFSDFYQAYLKGRGIRSDVYIRALKAKSEARLRDYQSSKNI